MHSAANPAVRTAARALQTLRLRLAILALASAAGSLLAVPPPGARPGSGRITVTTQPAGAAVYIDGHLTGKAPKEIEGLGPGKYYLRVELDGYRPAEAVVELSSSQNSRTVEVELTSTSAPRRVEPAPVAPVRPVAPVATPPPAATPIPATPAPTALMPPPPRATPAPPPVRPLEPPPAAPSPAVPEGIDETIQRLVAAHLKSISDGDIDTYLRLCASKVDLYDEGMQTREAIRKSRQKLKERWPSYEIANVRDLTVRDAEQKDVRRASVTYDWNVSNPQTGKKASGTANDILDFKQVGGQWLIVKARQNVQRGKGRSQ